MGKATPNTTCWQRCGDRRGAAVLVTGLIMVLTIDDTSRYESPHSSLVAGMGQVERRRRGCGRTFLNEREHHGCTDQRDPKLPQGQPCAARLVMAPMFTNHRAARAGHAVAGS